MQLHTKGEYAKILGLSTGSMTRLCRGILKPALVGHKLDRDHDAAQVYELHRAKIVYHGLPKGAQMSTTRDLDVPPSWKPTRSANPSGPPPVPPPPGIVADPNRAPSNDGEAPATGPDQEIISVHNQRLSSMLGRNLTNAELNEFGAMELRKLLDIYGTDDRFITLLRASKVIEDINEKRIKNAEKEGSLINRDLVSGVLFALLDSTFIQLVDDAPTTLTSRLATAVKAGEDLETMEEMVAKILSQYLKAVKKRIISALGGK